MKFAPVAIVCLAAAIFAGCVSSYGTARVDLSMHRPARVEIGEKVRYIAVLGRLPGAETGGAPASRNDFCRELVESALLSELSRLEYFLVVDADEYREAAARTGRYGSPRGYDSPFARALLTEPESVALIVVEVESGFEMKPRSSHSSVELVRRNYRRADPKTGKKYIETRTTGTVGATYVESSAAVQVVFKVYSGRERELLHRREYSRELNSGGEGVARTSVELVAGFAATAAADFAAEISPGRRSYSIRAEGGDTMARNLINAGAFFEGEKRILDVLEKGGIDGEERAANLYNLGVSFEARGRTATASQYYKQAYALDGKSRYRSAADRVEKARNDD